MLQAQLRAIIHFLLGDGEHQGDNRCANKLTGEDIRGGTRKRAAQKEVQRMSLGWGVRAAGKVAASLSCTILVCKKGKNAHLGEKYTAQCVFVAVKPSELAR